MTVNTIKKVNEIYHIIKINLNILRKMFKNHKIINDKIILADKMLMQVFMSIAEKTENIETKREFNKIIKNLNREN